MPTFLTAEDGSFLTTEDGTYLILEQLGPSVVPPGVVFSGFGFGLGF